MDRRLQLNTVLKELVANVYFQPPENVQMEYPCIVYTRDNIFTEFANNEPYNTRRRYQVTVMDRDPDSAIVGAVSALPMCTYSNGLIVEGVYQDIFTLYF